MGQRVASTIVYVGLARLPQPLVTPAPSVAVELEVESHTRRIVAASSTLQLPALERLLREVLVDKPVDAVAGCPLLELEVRYSAPFTTALRVAVQAAVRRATDGATCAGRTPPEQVELSSA